MSSLRDEEAARGVYFFQIKNATSFKTKLLNIVVPKATSVQLQDTSAQPIDFLNLAFSQTRIRVLGFSTNGVRFGYLDGIGQPTVAGFNNLSPAPRSNHRITRRDPTRTGIPPLPLTGRATDRWLDLAAEFGPGRNLNDRQGDSATRTDRNPLVNEPVRLKTNNFDYSHQATNEITVRFVAHVGKSSPRADLNASEFARLPIVLFFDRHRSFLFFTLLAIRSCAQAFRTRCYVLI
ncbi:hypothetical protein FRB98_008964 [Tulasnella sp. 332]|nr:hypothetical protein FRB98_008964 [Tulasnella sp. 332]